MAQPTPDPTPDPKPRRDINLWSLHPGAGVEDCILVGGPRDGLEFGMSKPTPGLRFPIMGPSPPFTAEGMYSDVLARINNGLRVQAVAYEMEYCWGSPSRDDRGRLRYVYRGIVDL